MTYFNADEARKVTSGAKQFKHLGAILTELLGRIMAEARRGNNDYIGEGWGPAVNLDELTEALQTLGYKVEDISHKRTPGGSTYIGRSLRISW